LYNVNQYDGAVDLLLSWRQEIFWISCLPVSLDPKSVVEIFPREVDSIVSSADKAIFFTYNKTAKLKTLTQEVAFTLFTGHEGTLGE
jgi:hypothetical protein